MGNSSSTTRIRRIGSLSFLLRYQGQTDAHNGAVVLPLADVQAVSFAAQQLDTALNVFQTNMTAVGAAAYVVSMEHCRQILCSKARPVVTHLNMKRIFT